ncbi:MAG: galactokinase [Cyclobacteriaceae bacterium]|nr:MAG: galactokinase [Cyclobacteriaceae bacterium]
MAEKKFIASAPGRMDVMGGIADYSGSLVLQKAIGQQTRVEIALRNDFICNLYSQLPDGEELHFSVNYRLLLHHNAVNYSYARNILAGMPGGSWASYVLGCVLVLQKEKGIDFRGADFTIHSEIAHGKGVASSAALEVATLRALAKAFAVNFQKTELAHFAQTAENYVAGAPCGLMDQLASAFGRPHTLQPIICQPDQLLEAVPIPSSIAFFGIDSGIRHQVAGASYADVRCAAFMGYTIIARSLGVTEKEIIEAKARKHARHLPFAGYLSNITPAEFEDRFAALLPEIISGEDFKKLFGSIIDPVTAVNSAKKYSVKVCTAHPVYENQRVKHFLEHLKTITGKPHTAAGAIRQMGRLMLASHQSYSACGLGTPRTDEIVEQAISLNGIAGARITGGGNGGTVCLLTAGGAGAEAARELHHRLCARYGQKFTFFE